MDNHWNGKITDFGLAKVKDETTKTLTTSGITLVQTLQWISPEVLDGNSATEKSDIYSFGMILYETATNIIPFQNLKMKDILDSKKSNITIPDYVHPKLKEIIQGCWSQTPAARPTLNSILNILEACSEATAIQEDFISSEFDFPPDLLAKGWIKKENYLTLELQKTPFGPNELAHLEWKNLIETFRKLHGTENYEISRAFAVENPALSQGFKSRISILRKRIFEDPNLFKKVTHKNTFQAWRQWQLDYLEKFTQKFPNQIHEEIKVIPVFHAIKKEDVAWKICGNGFANLSLLDDGWFGKGMYFTSCLEYAATVYSETNSQGEYPIILSNILFGNVYPVVENPNHKDTFKGRSCIV